MKDTLDDIGIVCLDHLGDAVLKSGFVQAVRSKWPAASICMFCTERTSEYWRLCPHIDRVRLARPIGPGETIFAWESEKKLFDLVIAPRAAPDYTGCHFLVRATKAPMRIGFRQIHFIRGEDCNQAFTHLVDLPPDGAEHAAVSPARLLTALTLDSDTLPPPSVYVGPETRQWASREIPAGSWLAIGLGAALPHKMWPPEAFAQVAGKFAEPGWGVVLIGSAPERPLTARFLARRSPAAQAHPFLNLVGDTSIEEMAAVLERCTLFIGNDSGPKHVAAALHKPVVEISWINCDDAALRYDRNFAAFGTRAIVVRPPRKFTPQETFAGEAVRSVPVEMVVDAAETLLKEFTA
jgi:ADP-heptose:LPS heptosyltransferase